MHPLICYDKLNLILPSLRVEGRLQAVFMGTRVMLCLRSHSGPWLVATCQVCEQALQINGKSVKAWGSLGCDARISCCSWNWWLIGFYPSGAKSILSIHSVTFGVPLPLSTISPTGSLSPADTDTHTHTHYRDFRRRLFMDVIVDDAIFDLVPYLFYWMCLFFD